MGLGQSYLQFGFAGWFQDISPELVPGFVGLLWEIGLGSSFLYGLFCKRSLSRSRRCSPRLFFPNTQFWTKISFSFIVTRPTKCSKILLVVMSAHQMLLDGCSSLPSISWCQQSSCLLSLWFIFSKGKNNKGHTAFNEVLLSGSRKWKISHSCWKVLRGKLQKSLSHPLNIATLCTTAQSGENKK